MNALNAATGQETPLAEVRSVDDQLEWLDDNTVVYGSPDSGGPSSPSRRTAPVSRGNCWARRSHPPSSGLR